MVSVNQEYLSPSPPPPAINEAMVKASERLEKGLPVYNFASGNVGALPLNLSFFNSIDIRLNDNLPESIHIIAEVMRKGLLDSLYPKATGLTYSTTGGTTSAKAAALRYFKDIHGIPLLDEDTKRVLVSAGGQQAMATSLRSLKPGTDVLMLQWEYAPVSPILKDHGLNEIRVMMGDDLSLDVADFEKKLGDKQVFYLSMPNNPTGYTSAEDLRIIVKTMEERGSGVVWDAPYVFMLLRLVKNKAVFDRRFLEKTLERFKEIGRKYHESTSILSSLSKTCLIAGLRIGMATASPHWITNMSAIIGRENLSSPTLSFIIGERLMNAFLDNPICHEWTCEVLADRLTLLIEEIGDHLILPQNNTFGALYALVKTPKDGDQFAGKLVEEKGIVGVPGSSFHGGPANAFRLSLVATPWTEGDKTWRESVAALKSALG